MAYNKEFRFVLEKAELTNETLSENPTVCIEFYNGDELMSAIVEAKSIDQLWKVWLLTASDYKADPDQSLISMRSYIEPPDIYDLFRKIDENDCCVLFEKYTDFYSPKEWTTAAIMTGYLTGTENWIRFSKRADKTITLFYTDRQEKVLQNRDTAFELEQRNLLLQLYNQKEV